MTAQKHIVFSQMPREDSHFGSGPPQDASELLKRYVSLAAHYKDALCQLGVDVICLEAPSIYQSAEALAVLGVTATTPHIAVRTIPAFRPVRGLANYVVFDGPSDELEREVTNSLRSGLNILAEAKAVLCTDRLLADDLVARGLTNAITLPPPASILSSQDLAAFGDSLRAVVFKS